jgi:TRAP transporter TAXI family solute receptor
MYSGGQQPIRLNAAAGGAGGSWYVLLEGLAKLIYDINPNLEIQVVEGGGISNHENVGLGRIPMAILNPPMTAAALAGRPPFEHPHSDLRVGISNLSVNYLQFVVAQGIPLASLEEWPQTGYPLRMPVDRAGTVDRMVFELALQHLGMSDQGTEGWTSRLVPTRNYNEQLALYAREETDGFWQFMVMPSPSIEAGHSIRPLKFLSLPQDFIQKLEQLGWTSAKLPEGAYDVIEKPVVTVSMGTSLGFHASVPDDVVFTIVEAVCEHPDRVQAVHPAALGFDPEQAYLGAGGPLHPGAEKYFRTKGWSA